MTPYLADTDLTVYCGDALDVLRQLPDGSVDCCVTSPPYWGLRDYGTGEWEGGDEGCDHTAAVQPRSDRPAGGLTGGKATVEAATLGYRDVCGKCGARRVDRQIGLEQSPDEYVQAMVAVFREVRRVLAPHGTCWVNLGDSYAGSRAGEQGETGQMANRSVAAARSRERNGGAADAIVRGKRNAKRWGGGNLPHGEGLKPKDLVGIPWRVAFALQADGWWLRSDIIWCLSGGTRLYARTQKGEQPQMLKDLVRLDPSTVELWNGERWTEVVSWTRAEVRGEPLEIELASGERIGCTPEHVWPTQRGNVRADELAVGDVIATTRLPEPAFPDRPELLPDASIGYLIGRYLADGSVSGDTVQIACHADEADGLVARLGPVAFAFHGSAVAHRTKGKAATVNLNGPLSLAVIRAYVHGTDAKTKGLKPRVWRRSNSFLHAILDGYLDGDAHWDGPNMRYRLGFTRNDRLAADIRTLAARLGCPIRLSLGWTEGFGRRWPVYRGDLRLATLTHHNARQQGRVIAVRRSRGRHFWDVEVADDPHLFALASGVLTHNSKPNPMPESVTDRPTKAHEYLFLLTRAPRYFFDQEAVREPATYAGEQLGIVRGTKRRASANGRGQEASGNESPSRAYAVDALTPAGRNVRSVWEIATQPYPEAHFATFPEELPRRAIAAGCPLEVCRVCGKPRERIVEREQFGKAFSATKYDETAQAGPLSRSRQAYRAAGLEGPPPPQTLGWSDCGHNDYRPGRVLDPFAGAGTTLLVARKLGRHSIGIELNPDYCRLIADRTRQLSLLAEGAA